MYHQEKSSPHQGHGVAVHGGDMRLQGTAQTCALFREDYKSHGLPTSTTSSADASSLNFTVPRIPAFVTTHAKENIKQKIGFSTERDSRAF